MLNVAMVLGDAEAIEMAIEEDIGIAFISHLAAIRGLELGCVVEVDVDGMDLYRKIYLARSRQLPSTRSKLEFWDSVKSHNRERVKTRLGE
jgi:DNA-binding transcriptional LysR family regulator